MNKLLEKIISEKTPIYFISPHLDDAALSCGGLLKFLAGKTDVTVISVFTSISQPPYSLSVKAFLKQCKNSDPENLFRKRRYEDRKIFKSLGIKTQHLGFVDAQWRKKVKLNIFEKICSNVFPEVSHVYPIYRRHVISGKISKLDKEIIENVEKKIKEIIKEDKNALIFCPAAIGNHVDHVITNICCLKIFSKIILWSDFPYNLRKKFNEYDFVKYKQMIFSFNEAEKIDLIKKYKTQFAAIFPSGKINMENETYFLN